MLQWWQLLVNGHPLICFILAMSMLSGTYWLLISMINAVKCMVVAYFNRHKKYHDDMEDDDD